MTNTFALTDFDVYDDDYDNFRSKRRLQRRRRLKRRSLRRKYHTRPPSGVPPVRWTPKKQIKPIRKRPKIVRGRPIKLPPKPMRGLPVKPKPLPKFATIKVKPALRVKTKTPINHLIKATNKKTIKKPVSTAIEKKVTAQVIKNEAAKKAMASDKKSSKMIKIIAGVGIVGITGFGIYKFIQNKKQVNGHIS